MQSVDWWNLNVSTRSRRRSAAEMTATTAAPVERGRGFNGAAAVQRRKWERPPHFKIAVVRL